MLSPSCSSRRSQIESQVGSTVILRCYVPASLHIRPGYLCEFLVCIHEQRASALRTRYMRSARQYVVVVLLYCTKVYNMVLFTKPVSLFYVCGHT